VLVVGCVQVLTGGMSVGSCTVFVEECGRGMETRGPSIAIRKATSRETWRNACVGERLERFVLV